MKHRNWINCTERTLESNKYEYIRRMLTERVSDQIMVKRALCRILLHADTKKHIQNQPNKGTRGYNHYSQQHKRRNARCVDVYGDMITRSIYNPNITPLAQAVTAVGTVRAVHGGPKQ